MQTATATVYVYAETASARPHVTHTNHRHTLYVVDTADALDLPAVRVAITGTTAEIVAFADAIKQAAEDAHLAQLASA